MDDTIFKLRVFVFCSTIVNTGCINKNRDPSNVTKKKKKKKELKELSREYEWNLFVESLVSQENGV